MRSRIALFSFSALAVFAVPTAASAVTFIDTLNLVNTVINAFVPILLSVAVVVFFFGVIKYLTSLGNSDKRNEAVQLMIWGVVAIFVMVSLWGIIRLLQSTFRVGNSEPVVPRAIQLGQTF